MPRREEVYANTHIQPAYWRFQTVELRKCYQLGQMVCREEVESELESALCFAGWRCTCSFVCRACLRFLRGALSVWKEASHLILKKHCQVTIYCSRHRFMPRTLNTPLLHFSDLGAWFRNELFRLPYCGARDTFFSHFGPIPWQPHVRLFKLYPTSLPCHSCRHVEKLQDFVCCL